MSEVIIGNIELIDLKRKVKGLKLFKLKNPHVDDDFPDIVVPAGYITNGASVPTFLHDVISPTGDLFRASVVHDYLYYSKIVSRREADAIFREIVLDDTGSWLLAYLTWSTVRVSGSAYWNAAGSNVPQVYVKGDK
jgi:hypothetical protein